MSFNRAQYERLVQISRELVKATRIGRVDYNAKVQIHELAEEVFKMSEDVIGQQTPLFKRG